MMARAHRRRRARLAPPRTGRGRWPPTHAHTHTHARAPAADSSSTSVTRCDLDQTVDAAALITSGGQNVRQYLQGEACSAVGPMAAAAIAAVVLSTLAAVLVWVANPPCGGGCPWDVVVTGAAGRPFPLCSRRADGEGCAAACSSLLTLTSVASTTLTLAALVSNIAAAVSFNSVKRAVDGLLQAEVANLAGVAAIDEYTSRRVDGFALEVTSAVFLALALVLTWTAGADPDRRRDKSDAAAPLATAATGFHGLHAGVRAPPAP
jgi:hypothetical protein